jgi:E3 ubiquitin-protein ligase EDD1
MGSTAARPVVPAQYVPEDLIAQAQVVLQGKSRNLIVRELQRTNLDVNLAVNNLLSRDDEEGDDAEDSADSYVSEDLMSLLDSGMGGAADPVMLSDAVLFNFKKVNIYFLFSFQFVLTVSYSYSEFIFYNYPRF